MAAVVLTVIHAPVPLTDRQKRQPTEAEIQQLQTIRLPRVQYPFPITTCKNAQSAMAECVEWISKKDFEGMFRSPRVRRAHIKANSSEMSMKMHVDSGEREAVLAGKLALWGFAVDDYFDDEACFEDKDASLSLLWDLNLIFMWSFPDDQRLRENLLWNMEGEDTATKNQILAYVDSKLAIARRSPGTHFDTTTDETHSVLRCFGEIWREVADSAPPQFMRRWAYSIQEYLRSIYRETRIRIHHCALSVDDYISLRRESVALNPMWVLCEYTQGRYLPYQAFETPQMKRFVNTADDCVAFLNDIFSLEKEVLRGDVHNLVIVISHERNCLYAEAMAIAWEMFLTRLKDLDRDYEDLDHVTPEENKPCIAAYLKTLQHCLWGGHSCYVRSARYKDCLLY